MEQIRERVTEYYLVELRKTQSPKMAMHRTVTEHGFKRSAVYKWLKTRRKHGPTRL